MQHSKQQCTSGTLLYSTQLSLASYISFPLCYQSLSNDMENILPRSKHMDDNDFIMQKFFELQKESIEVIRQNAIAMEKQAESNKMVAAANERLADTAENQTAAIEKLVPIVQSANNLFKTWYFRILVLAVLLIIILLGGGAALKQLKDLSQGVVQ